MARGAQGHDLEGDHGEDGDEDDPAPHSRAVDVERRMEPPIRNERGDTEHDQRHDERRTAPVGELLHERGDGAPFVNTFPTRGLLLGASGLLALAGGLGCFAARRVLRLSRRDVLHLDFHIDGLLRTVFGAAGHLHSGTPQHLQNLVVVHRGINPSRWACIQTIWRDDTQFAGGRCRRRRNPAPSRPPPRAPRPSPLHDGALTPLSAPRAAPNAAAPLNAL